LPPPATSSRLDLAMSSLEDSGTGYSIPKPISACEISKPVPRIPI
jgi:hypothetical protein